MLSLSKSCLSRMSGKPATVENGWVEGSAFGGTAWKLRVSKDTSKRTKFVLRLETKDGGKSSGGPGVPQEAKGWTRELPEQSRATDHRVCECVCMCVSVCGCVSVSGFRARRRDNPSGPPLVSAESTSRRRALVSYRSRLSQRMQLDPVFLKPAGADARSAHPPTQCS